MNPNKLTVIKNADKGFHEKWDDDRSLGNIPHPFRCLCIGPPNCGKTGVAVNLFLRQKPHFTRLIVVHIDKDFSAEWDLCDPTELTDTVPDFRDIDGKEKTLIVFEDYEFSHLSKKDLALVSRLWGYCSTHKNTSIIACQQDPSVLPAIMRRLSNVFILWPAIDISILDRYGTKMGLLKGELALLIRKHCKEQWDGIWLDNTKGTRAKVRLNCFTVIDEIDPEHVLEEDEPLVSIKRSRKQVQIQVNRSRSRSPVKKTKIMSTK